jgi:hypothetical protein
MEQSLRLLIQLVLEFVPMMATLVQKRGEAIKSLTKFQPSSEVIEVIQTVSGLVETINSRNTPSEFEQEKIWQQQLAVYQRQTQLQVAKQARETALKLPEINKILDSWPLRLYPSQILESHPRNGRTPLKIFLAPPQVQFDKFDSGVEKSIEIEPILAEGLRDFINKNYSLHCDTRPTEFLAGAWDSKRFHSESSIKALFGMLKSEPMLILESEVDGDYLNFRISYWGLGQENYYYKTISRLPYKQIVDDAAKARALEWRTIRDELILLGEDLEIINQLGKDNVRNLAILEKEELWQHKGIDVSKLSLNYQINRQDIERFSQVLITCHCLVAGWVADTYHLVHHDVPPLLPELLPNLLQDALDLQSVGAIATGYKQIYQALEGERRYWVPEIALQLAQSLSHLPDKSWAQEQVDYSVNAWLQLRQGTQLEETNTLQAMQLALRIEDMEYVEKLRIYFAAVGDIASLVEVEAMLGAIAELKVKQPLDYAYLHHTLTGHSGKISAVAISPDGQTLVSGCGDKTIKLWDVETGKFIRNLNGNAGEISSIAISPDGHFLAVGSGDYPKSNVKVWHINSGKLLHTLLGHQKPVNFVTISSDGQIIASGSNKIKIWNLHTGERICTLWHTSAVHAAAISSDGTILASGSSDKKIRLWNPRNGELLCNLSGHTDEVKAVAITPDGQTLISTSADKTIKIWHLSTGKVVQTLNAHTDEVKAISLSNDGQILVSGSGDKTIKIWDLNSGEVLQTLKGHSGAVNSVAISGDNQFIVSGSSDKTIKIWRVR